jgi:hypothetical protein
MDNTDLLSVPDQQTTLSSIHSVHSFTLATTNQCQQFNGSLDPPSSSSFLSFLSPFVSVPSLLTSRPAGFLFHPPNTPQQNLTQQLCDTCAAAVEKREEKI